MRMNRMRNAAGGWRRRQSGSSALPGLSMLMTLVWLACGLTPAWAQLDSGQVGARPASGGGGGGGGGGGSTNAIEFLNGSGTNTALYNATFRTTPNWAVTNLGTATNLVLVWTNGKPVGRMQLTNHATVTVTNVPAAGSEPSGLTLEVTHVGTGPSNVTIVAASPIQITWRDGIGPNITTNARNFIHLWFNGTNIDGFTLQDLETGAGAIVRSNTPSITGLRMPGSGAGSNYVWVCTNSTTGEGEWRTRPRVGVYRTITIGAAALVTNLTSGALIKQEETVANFINRYYMEFSGTVTNIVTFSLPMPEAWDRGSVEIKCYWSSTNSAANQTNVWGIATSFVDDDDPIDAAYGTEVVTADPVSAQNDLMISSVLTPTPGTAAGAAGAMIDIRVSRLPGHVNDQMGGVAKLYGIVLRYLETTTEPTASW